MREETPAAEADPESGLPIGAPVPPRAVERPAHPVLAGSRVRLEALDAARHSAGLWSQTHGPDAPARWQYLFDAPFEDLPAFRPHLAAKSRSVDPLFYAIIDAASGEALGAAALMRIEPAHRCLEIGNILYGRALARSAAATEAQYLLMRYVFDGLGYRRYEWKCNALNAPSRRAALRLGFTFEGIFRKHMIVRGRSRDTAWYAITDDEWPRVGAALERWLAADNFDDAGRQRRSLEAIRGDREGRGAGSGHGR